MEVAEIRHIVDAESHMLTYEHVQMVNSEDNIARPRIESVDLHF
jgi:hypothetical protein